MQEILEGLDEVKNGIDICIDNIAPPSFAEVETMYNHLEDLKKKGVNLRIITQVTLVNIPFCKMLIKIADVRHLESVRGNFGIVDSTMYRASFAMGEHDAQMELISSRSKAFVDQQQFFFDMLWNKAIPVEAKIKEIEEGVMPENTEIIYGAENLIRWALHDLSLAKRSLDLVGDRHGPSILFATKVIPEKYREVHGRGVKQRFITEITKENIEDCKKLMSFQELRHLDGLKGYLAIRDSSVIVAHAFGEQDNTLAHGVISTVSMLVEQQKYYFETLWSKAIPADQKIKEIELGWSPEVIETIVDPRKTQKLGQSLLKAANSEVLIIFSTTNAFRRQEKEGLSVLIKGLVQTNPSIKIRIIVPSSSAGETQGIAELRLDDHLQKAEQQPIEIRYIEERLQTRVSVLIVDRSFSLAVELKNDTEESSIEAMGLATYSNSKATVLSYVSMFESLWRQSELYAQISSLYEQLKVHDKMQNEFVNIAAHELRNPIQPILGLAEVLRDQLEDDPQKSELLNAIIKSAERLQHLQEDILDVTRIESNLLRLELMRFSLGKLIRETITDFEARQRSQDMSSKVSFAYEGDIDEKILVQADKNRITQVLSNLLDNALKFSTGGTVLVQSWISSDTTNVIVSVKDFGTGIDEGIFPRLFTKFASKSKKGTGLGLYISKSIIEAHGGRIWAENNDGGPGATFSFSIPVEHLK